jgi:hypothetical protein
VVYGPQSEADKLSFMQEIRQINQTVHERWLLLGDFNLIYRASDKSNGHINRRLMNSFRLLVDEVEMKELHLHGRRFTWSSGTQTPTQTKIDHVFASKEWEILHSDCHLQAGSTPISDHCPMILSCAPFHKRFKGFRFESWWLLAPDFKDIVSQSWQKSVNSANKARVIHIKLSRLAKELKKWSRQKTAAKKQDSLATEQLVFQLDQTQDDRQLTEDEIQVRKEAKNKTLAYAAFRKIRLRQRSRLTWIRAGDANTKLFQLRARNHITALKHDGVTCITQEVKSRALEEFFTKQFGTNTARTHTLNWELLSQQQHDLQDLERDISEDEIHAAVMQIHSEKALGLDGYTGAFFKACWDIIRVDLTAAIKEIFALRADCWNLLNSAHMVLIEKRKEQKPLETTGPLALCIAWPKY